VFAVVVVLLIGGDDDSGPSAEVRSRQLVAGYCLYTSSAVPQFESCLDDVTPGTVRSEDSSAARYARHELDACKGDAGALCGPLYREVVETRAEEEADQLLRGR
jgi:hypothetical protein